MRTKPTARILAGLLAAALVAALLGGCSRLSAPGAPTVSRQIAPSTGESAPSAGAPAQDSGSSGVKGLSPAPVPSASRADRMVIRNANMRLEVAKVTDAVRSLREIAKRQGAVVSNLQLSSDTGGGAPEPVPGAPDRAVTSGLPFTASVTLLVPVGRFDAFRAETEKLGKVLSETSADDDVTQQHADLKARLTNAKAEEVRLRSFFDQARSVNDMLSIERELARVRGEIESMTAQLATLERQAAMATLTVELVEPKPIVRPSNGIDWGFADALTTGIQAMTGILRAVIVILVATAPLWIAAIALLFVVRWRLKVRRARREPQPEQPAP